MIKFKVYQLRTKKWNVLFADGMTCFLSDKSSYGHSSFSYECFSKFSGLKLNEGKKKFLRLGVYNLPESFPHGSKLSIQILGAQFDYDELPKEKSQFWSNPQ